MNFVLITIGDSLTFSELEIIRIVSVCSARPWSLSPVHFIWMFRDHIFCDLYFRFAHNTDETVSHGEISMERILFSLCFFMCFVGWLLILFRREPGTGNNTSKVSFSLWRSVQHKTVYEITQRTAYSWFGMYAIVLLHAGDNLQLLFSAPWLKWLPQFAYCTQ